jgi:cell wall-associated NlpC family hydrolase
LFAGRALLRALFVGAAAVVVLLPADAALADPSLAQLETQIDQKNNEVEKVIESYNLVTEQLKDTQAKLDALKIKMQPLQDKVDAASANVSKIAYQAYRSGSNLRTASVLLNAGSSSTIMDQLATLDQISKAQQADLTKYSDAKKGYDAEKAPLDKLLAAQNAQKTDLETKRTKIEGDLKTLEGLRNKAKAAGAKDSGANDSNYTPPSVKGSAGKAVSYAFAQLGDPYKYGASGPSSFDCSGLTMMAWKQAGVSLPHNAASQYHGMKHISKGSLAAGDLVFYNGLGHVAIYVGGGNVIHAPHTGTVVKLVSMTSIGTPYGYGRP